MVPARPRPGAGEAAMITWHPRGARGHIRVAVGVGTCVPRETVEICGNLPVRYMNTS